MLIGKWETTKFNNCLQVEVCAVMNTGNMARQTISFSGLSEPFVQTYKYDSLYRLKEANEQAGTTENWKQNFTYDRYGNRQTHDKEINGNLVAENSQTHPTIDTNTNRFDTSQGYAYDKVGNLIIDGDGRTFTFDGNNKQTYVFDGNKTIGVYFYDGNGMRVKKERYSDGNLAETVIFVYSGGKLAEEFSTQAPTSPKTKYLTEDHLGIPRIITDVEGEVVSRRDFLPFGEDITSIVGARSTNGFQYSTTEDDVRQKFTGYQKDEETGLDFAEARMYENRHARFTAVDPLLASGKSVNPQTFNRFVYVGNNPINITDPLGLDWFFNKDKNHYRWFDDKADDGYTAVDFGDGNSFEYEGCFTSDCSGTARAYLVKSGGWNWDTQSLLNNHRVYNDLNNINIPLPNFVKSGSLKGGRNFLRGVGNSPWTTNFIGTPADIPETDYLPSIPGGISLEKLGIKPPFGRETYDNSVEAAAGYGTELGLTVTTAIATKKIGNTFSSRFGFKPSRYTPPSKCFVAGTLIHTENGLVPIEEINTGDKVLSYNEDGRKVEYQAVVRTFVNKSSNLFEVKIEGETVPLVVTNGHPFYVYRTRSDLSSGEDDPNGEWIDSDKLVAGDLVLKPDENWTEVLSVNRIEGKATVYNFEVEKNHDYFVGSQGVLVHNQTICMDDAVDKAVDFVGSNGIMEVSGSGSFQFRSSSINAQGQTVTKIGRLDVNPRSGHVNPPGGTYNPHLNLETQINGVTIKTGPLADPHIKITPSTIRPGDIP